MKSKSLLAVLLCLLIGFSCSRDVPFTKRTAPLAAPLPLSIGIARPLTSDPNCSCGAWFSGSHSYTQGSGHWIYANQTLDLSCATVGDTITLDCMPVDVPNTFTVYDGQGDVVAYTPWVGNANWSGPWGQSLSGQANNYIKFIYQASTSYYLQVATVTNSTPSAATSDTWNVSVSCATGAPTCPGCGIDSSTTCMCPTQLFSGSYSYTSGAGFHIYAPIKLNTTCSPSAVGDTAILDCMPDDVPNTFTVVDGHGSIVAATSPPWVGNATWQGPWGSSVSGQANNYIRWIVAANTTYYLSVATVVNASPSQATSDAWNATLTCSAPH